MSKVQVKPLSGAHPGFAPLAATKIAKVESLTKSVKDANNETQNFTALKFKDAEDNVFAELNNLRNDFAWIILKDEGNKRIGALLKKDAVLNFPNKGKLSSVPVGDKLKSSRGTEYQRHDVILSGVKLADLVGAADDQDED